MTEGDSPLAQVLRDVLANSADPLHSQTCDLQILFRSLHQVTDVEESRMLKTAESVARDKSIKSRALIVLSLLQARALSAAKRLTPILTRSRNFESR